MTEVKNEVKKQELKALKAGDIILLTDGNEGEFLRLKRTRFTCLVKEEVWEYPIAMFERLVKKGEPNPVLEKVQEIVKQHKNETMGTVYGPSTIVGLTDDFKSVALMEFGAELYHLTLQDFLDQYEENGIVSY